MYIYICVCDVVACVPIPAQKHYRIQVYFLPGTTYFLVAFPIANQTNKSSHSAKEDLLINGLCLEGRDNFRLNMAVLLMGGFEVKATPQNLPSVKTDMELQTVRTMFLLKRLFWGFVLKLPGVCWPFVMDPIHLQCSTPSMFNRSSAYMFDCLTCHTSIVNILFEPSNPTLYKWESPYINETTVDGQNIQTLQHTLCWTPAPPNLNVSVRVLAKVMLGVWFLSSIQSNPPKPKLTLNFGGEGVVSDRFEYVVHLR